MRTGLPDELAGTMAGYPAGSSGAPSRHRPLVTAHQNGQHKPQGRHNEYVLGPGLSPLVRARGRCRGRVWAPPPPLTPPPVGMGQHARHRQTCYPGAQLTCTTERAASYASESRVCGSAGECGTHEQHASRLRYCE